MEQPQIIQKVADYVKNHATEDVAAHDWWHIVRVWEATKKISAKEGGNLFVVELIALLHDVYDHKFFPDANIPELLMELLTKLEVIQHIEIPDLENILHSIDNLSFKGGFNKTKLSLEGQIAQDADRLDAVGAIAIARTFAYGGKFDRELYNPETGITEVNSQAEYVGTGRHSINHFYEKLLKLKDLMNTKTAKEMAQSRHHYMEQFLDQFFAEWNGSDLEEGYQHG